MSYVSGLQMTEEMLEEHTEEGTCIDAALIKEALLEDFQKEELLDVCNFWLSDYGCQPKWRTAVISLRDSLRVGAK